MAVELTATMYSGVGTGALSTYATGIYALDPTTINVYDNGVLQTLGASYTLSGVGDDTDGIDVIGTFPLNDIIYIERLNPLKQEVATVDAETVFSAVFDAALDLAMMIAQEQQRQLGRSLMVPMGETAALLPAATARASMTLAFDADGNPIVIPTITDSATAVAAAAAAAVSATAAAGSATSAGASFLSFDERYLGAKAANPAVDNEGNVLVAGALYFNTVEALMLVWSGSAWLTAYAAVSGYIAGTGITLSGSTIAVNSVLTVYAGINPSSDVQTLLGSANMAAFRTSLGTLVGTNVEAWSAVLDHVAAGVNDAAIKPNESLLVACSDETTSLATGVAKVTFHMPYAFTLTGVRASLVTPQASGALFTIDLLMGGVSIFSTTPTFTNASPTTVGAVTPAVIATPALTDDAIMTVCITQIGDGTAKGLKVTLLGHRT